MALKQIPTQKLSKQNTRICMHSQDLNIYVCLGVRIDGGI